MTVRNGHLVPPLLAALSSGLVLTLWACAPSISPVRPVLNGAALDPAVSLPALTLTRTDGGTFNSAETRGRLSLFFFG